MTKTDWLRMPVALASVLAASLLALLASAESADAAFPGKNGARVHQKHADRLRNLSDG